MTPQINYMGRQNALHRRYLNRSGTPHRINPADVCAGDVRIRSGCVVQMQEETARIIFCGDGGDEGAITGKGSV